MKLDMSDMSKDVNNYNVLQMEELRFDNEGTRVYERRRTEGIIMTTYLLVVSEVIGLHAPLHASDQEEETPLIEVDASHQLRFH